MRLQGFGFMVAIGGLLTFQAATPSTAGGLGDLVGFGAQDVHIDPTADAPAAAGNTGQAKTPGQKIKKAKKVRLSRDCVKAGLKTAEECEAFRASQAKKPAKPAPAGKDQGGTAVTSTGTSAPADTGTPPEKTPPAETATDQPPAAGGNGAPTTVVAMPTTAGTQSTSTLSAVTSGGSVAPSTNCGSGNSTLGAVVAITPSC